MGRIEKGVGCSVSACANSAVRSLSRELLAPSDLAVSGEGRRVYLCQQHYRQWKKATRKTRELDRVRFG
jgi:hypothetical protein